MLTKRRNIIKFLILLTLVISIIIVIKSFGIKSLLNPQQFREILNSYGALSPLIFICVYIISTIFFLPGTPITIASGLIFGSILGTAYTVIGATIGAIIAFLVAKYLGEEFVESILKNKFKKIDNYNNKIEKSGLLVVLFLRLIPIFPFNGLNFALGLTKIKTKDYILGTFLGIIPGSFVLAYLGNSIATLSIFDIILSIVLFILLAFSPSIYKRIKKSKNLITQ